jgi:hypothetical protein
LQLLLILDIGTRRGVVSITPRPRFNPMKRLTVPTG